MRKILAVFLLLSPESWYEINRYRAEGLASYYAFEFHGNRTASGELFDMADFTAAHRTLPFGIYLKVKSKETNESIVVRVNDRGPYAKGRIIDLSEAAARAIGSYHDGVIPVSIEEIKILEPDEETDSLYRNTRVMDCLGNPDTLSGFSLAIWSTQYLAHALYVANDLYLKEDFPKVYICHRSKSRNKRFYVVISGIESRSKLEEYRSYFFGKGFIRAVTYEEK
jgi:rare lipoprotein A